MTKQFNLKAEFKPAGDQPEAIAGLLEGLGQAKPTPLLMLSLSPSVLH
jgi:excinuclease UvrABC helicase subunit UvrB